MFGFLKYSAGRKADRPKLVSSLVTKPQGFNMASGATESVDEHDPTHLSERLHEGKTLQLSNIGSPLEEVQERQTLLSVEASFGQLRLPGAPSRSSAQVRERHTRAGRLEGVPVALDRRIALAVAALVSGLMKGRLEAMNIHLIASIGGVVGVAIRGHRIVSQVAAQPHHVGLDSVVGIVGAFGVGPHPCGHGVNIDRSTWVKQQRRQDRPRRLATAGHRAPVPRRCERPEEQEI